MQPAHITDRKTVLCVSLELSKKGWKLALADDGRERPAIVAATAGQPKERLDQVLAHITQFKNKWKLPPDCEVVVIYEAGQDGFWIQRALSQVGVQVLVIDAASMPVSRQARRAKTDRIDAVLLLDTLQNWLSGRRGQVRMVHVPSEQAEAQRQLTRERGLLQKEICQHRDRMHKLLVAAGCWQAVGDDLDELLAQDQVRIWNGQPLPEPLRERLLSECTRLKLVQEQLRQLERGLLKRLPDDLRERIQQLAQLRGIGWVGATRLVLELYWRNFHNRRQVGACVGLVAQPYDSGQSRADQGISKQGNRRVRALLIELAWLWLRHQPDSAIAQWFAQRTAGNATNKRGKRIAIVAVARRLAIALWRFLSDAVVPQGAELKRA
jgi:transposase